MAVDPAPFAAFAPPARPQGVLRRAITTAFRRSEPECIAALLDAASLTESQRASAQQTARTLITAMRAKGSGSGVEALVQEYALSSQEGMALMCLAEALLRIPDTATRDALIRDKIADGDWKSHLGGKRSLFVNAATWGLVVTGKLVESVNDTSLSSALTRLIARAGEPVIRRAVDLAMRMMGEQFVLGETIGEALERSRKQEAKGFSYSFDMLGEAAMTAADAARYLADYEQAIHAIGKASAGRGCIGGPGISIKLSALHPRYSRAKVERVMAELLPRVKSLAELARCYDIGLNIDAEEADRLELSLDLLESLALDPALADWQGLGFVVQAYGKRCPMVIDWIIDLAQRSGRRIMVRLVKGAYWDAEIKRAQVDGLIGFPVYTRKVHTDVAYLACARRLLGAPAQVYPQFATHNAQTLAAILELAGPQFNAGDYEFQCLHGMGEALYGEVVGADRLDRPCRIYAPVGTHETLLAYLVRRLLENGANSSFVNRVADPEVSIDDLVGDPVSEVQAMAEPGQPHTAIALPADIYGARRNSAGLDLADELTLERVSAALQASAAQDWRAGAGAGIERAISNPADHRDRVGTVIEVTAPQVQAAATRAASSDWAQRSAAERASCLDRAAAALESEMFALLGLIMREAGKSLPNAISEVREAVDFLRYYAAQAREISLADTRPLGVITCISPWNFPLAIFIGQIAAALVMGNAVLAKPAEESPLIAAQGVRLLHEAGVPVDALQLLPGDGSIGAAAVNAAETAGVMFTGSTEVARLIQTQLAARLGAEGQPIMLIAETGGQNAMIVDSSALPEQVVADVIASAFDSAGQRCSALRILCLQHDIADRTLEMLRGALAELQIGRTDRLQVDIGPVITPEAKATIEAHVAAMRSKGCRLEQLQLPPEAEHGSFVAPTLIELDSIEQLGREVFGPVLHVVRFRGDGLDALVDAINATGYGLTFGLHTRLDTTIERATSRIAAGNVYVNRNVIGAVVGVQPFGGRGFSGTGPKAGGPLYLGRLARGAKPLAAPSSAIDLALLEFAHWLAANGEDAAAQVALEYGGRGLQGTELEFAGPVGERNLYRLEPRGCILLCPQTPAGFHSQIAAVLASGCTAAITGMPIPADLPAAVLARIAGDPGGQLAGALIEGTGQPIIAKTQELADRPGPIVPLQALGSQALANGTFYDLALLAEEVSISINTTAAGGNASLMTIG